LVGSEREKREVARTGRKSVRKRMLPSQSRLALAVGEAVTN
jgi:hypothetical protein